MGLVHRALTHFVSAATGIAFMCDGSRCGHFRPGLTQRDLVNLIGQHERSSCELPRCMVVRYFMQGCRIITITVEAFRQKLGSLGTDLWIGLPYPAQRHILRRFDQNLLEAPMLGDVVHVVLLL